MSEARSEPDSAARGLTAHRPRLTCCLELGTDDVRMGLLLSMNVLWEPARAVVPVTLPFSIAADAVCRIYSIMCRPGQDERNFECNGWASMLLWS